MAELIDLKTIHSDGRHNAFTDIIYWNGYFYVSFRTAESHAIVPNGDIIIIRSKDLVKWELCSKIDTGGDDRDPKLINCGSLLGIVFGTWLPRRGGKSVVTNAEFDLISHIAISKDGLTWSTPRQVYGMNYWLWRILPINGIYFCAAYHFPVRSDRDRRSVHLLRSENLWDWEHLCLMRMGGGPGEPVLFEPEEGVLRCVIRSKEPQNHSFLGTSEAPYTNWCWTDLGVMIHAPVVLLVEDRWIVAGRSQRSDLPNDPGFSKDSNYGASLWDITLKTAEHLLTVPSSGDCSYCGLVRGINEEILMTYYSQHESKDLSSSDIFLASLAVG